MPAKRNSADRVTIAQNRNLPQKQHETKHSVSRDHKKLIAYEKMDSALKG